MKKLIIFLTVVMFLSKATVFVPTVMAQKKLDSDYPFYQKLFKFNSEGQEIKWFKWSTDTVGLKEAEIGSKPIYMDFLDHLHIFYVNGREAQYDYSVSDGIVLSIPNNKYVYMLNKKGFMHTISYGEPVDENTQRVITLETGTDEFKQALNLFYEGFPELKGLVVMSGIIMH